MLRGLVDTPERRLLLATGALGFLAIGAIQAMYGPAFPALLQRYAIGIGQVGAVVSAHFLGSFVTIAASGVLLARFGYRPLLAAGAAGMALGAAGVALSPGWGWTLAAAFVGGLGFGLLDVAVNLLFARSYGAAATPALNLLNAAFGMGAVAGPLLVGALAPRLAPPFLVLAALTAVAGVLLLRVRTPRPLAPPAGVARLPLGPLLGFMGLYFVYVSCEVGVASWEPTFLAPTTGEARAAFLTSLYWAALTVGRLVAVPVSALVRPADMVAGAALVATAAAWLAALPGWAPAAYALVGFAFAPIFPTTLAWLQEVFPQRAERITPLAITGATLGPVLSAPAIGWAVAATGSDRIPLVLALLVLLLLTVVGAVWRGTRGASASPRAGGAASP